MDTQDIDQLGPVDFAVIEFPVGDQHFSGEVVGALADLVDSGTIRLLDLLVLAKDADGSIEAMEIDDLPGVDELRALETEVAEILAEEDVVHLAAAMEPGSVAGVVVWENTWAAPFGAAARRAGGQLIASGRIPIQAIAASIEARGHRHAVSQPRKKESCSQAQLHGSVSASSGSSSGSPSPSGRRGSPDARATASSATSS